LSQALQALEKAEIPESLREALCKIVERTEGLSSDIRYEFQYINLSADAEGRLILRDIVYDIGNSDEESSDACESE
jgi:hypothetical protein